MSKEEVKKQFGAHAEAYADSPVHAKGASLARLVELVEPRADWQMLDVATAAGHTAFIFAPHVQHVIATDITPEMLSVAASLASEREIHNVSFETADAEALPFADAQFDLVTCRIAPHHFPNIERFVAESYRVLKSSGILAVVDNIVPGSMKRKQADGKKDMELLSTGQYINEFERQRDPSHGRCLSVEEWENLYADAGFTVNIVETAEKRILFEPWVKRMGSDAATQRRLREMLLNAPRDVRDFLHPEPMSDDIAFYLTEAILLGIR